MNKKEEKKNFRTENTTGLFEYYDKKDKKKKIQRKIAQLFFLEIKENLNMQINQARRKKNLTEEFRKIKMNCTQYKPEIFEINLLFKFIRFFPLGFPANF